MTRKPHITLDLGPVAEPETAPAEPQAASFPAESAAHVPRDSAEEPEEEDTQKDKYLTFRIGTERYGIEIRNVTELIRVPPITPMPHLPSDIRGIISLRGEIVPVMDVRIRFGKESVPSTEKTCVIILTLNGRRLGLLVDLVEEVLGIPQDDIVPPPELTNLRDRFVQGVGRKGEQVILIINCMELVA
ncbi:MAG: purine-binding chemotaxis protein CheW [Clostridia bacterium]|nr:purine-binding chemotaxis protein CheW [Clostridia bacterium]